MSTQTPTNGKQQSEDLIHPAVMQVDRSTEGLAAQNDFENLVVTVCRDTVIHVVARPAGAPASTSEGAEQLLGVSGVRPPRRTG